jgi:Bacteriophage baseplate protein W
LRADGLAKSTLRYSFLGECGHARQGGKHSCPAPRQSVALCSHRNSTDGRVNANTGEGNVMNIDFPFHFDSRGRTASTGDEDHIRDMIEELLFTSPGERVNRPDFGGGLLRMVFEPNSPELASALQFTVQAALQRYLGDLIEVRALQVASEDSTLHVEVQYEVRRTGELRRETFAGSGPQ